MRTILIAENSGFCKGVKHAVSTAMTIPPENTYVFGEIIHNKDVTAKIAERGIVTVHDLSAVPNGARLLIRSHGVGQSVYEECRQRDIEVVDCTCGFVKRTQSIVREHRALGEQIVIVGEASHPEVVGINGWCEDSAIIFSSDESDFSVIRDKNLCVVCQTTFSKEKFDKIIKNIKKVCQKTVAVFETICYTTIGRQSEAEKLSKECDAMIVIGGLNSSNTNKLYDICVKNCNHVFRLENSDALQANEFIYFNKVGIVSGASTPDTQHQEVLLKMESIDTEGKATNAMEEFVAKIDNGQFKFKKGQLITAIISSADDEGVAVLLPFSKKEIVLDKNEIDCEEYKKEEFTAKAGSEIELMVVSLNPVKLSQKMIKKVKEEEAMIADIEEGKEFKVTCTGFNKGGLTSELGTYAVFVPAKEIRSGYVKELDKYVGKTLRLRALEIKKGDRKKEIIASQRVIIEEERAAKKAAEEAKVAAFFESIKVDDVVEGEVKRVTSFGAFVSVGGFDCLAHISDLSWTGVKKVEDVLEIGKKYEFKVLKIDDVNKKVSIGYKQLQPQPWDLAAEKYAVGDTVHGKVVRIVPFGAFVEVEKGIDGLVHVSQISHEWLENPTSVLTIGEEVDAKILALDPYAKKMTLSIKALLPEPEVKKVSKKSEDAEGKPSKRVRKDKNGEEEYREWTESGVGGASIADLLKSAD